MSAFEFTHPNGKRYRIVLGWGSSVCRDANLFGDSFSARAFIDELPPEAQSAIGRQFMDPFRVEPRHINPSLHAPTFGGRQDLHQPYLNPTARLCQAIAKSQLVVQLDESLVPVEDKRAEFRMKIRMQLNSMLLDERREAEMYQAQMDQETTFSKGLIYTGSAMHGLGTAIWDTLKWAKEVSDLVNPAVQLRNAINAAHAASNEEDVIKAYIKNLQAAQWREMVEALGFDPSQITSEMMAQAMDAANVIWEDDILRQDLITFAKDYAKAQHAVELTQMGGGALLDIVITAILAVFTAGAGVTVATAAKARHLPKLSKLGNLLLEFVEQSKKMAQYVKAKAERAAKGEKGAKLKEELVVERVNEPPRGSQGSRALSEGADAGTMKGAKVVPNRGIPEGITFEGTIHRATNPKYADDAWRIHAGNVSANHRYSSPGRGALYSGTSPEAVLGELKHYNANLDNVVFLKRHVSVENVLDLTSQSVRNQLGIDLNDLTRGSQDSFDLYRTIGNPDNDYFITHSLGDFAQPRYNGILVPSARESGSSHLILFESLKADGL